MLNEDLIKHLENRLDQEISSFCRVSGGDISLAYQIQTEVDTFFLKVNSNASALNMFQTEEIGLNVINKSKAIRAPKVYTSGKHGNLTYLLMDWIESKSPSNSDLELFGTQLAQLHAKKEKEFGFHIDNYIGSLPQVNKTHNNWLDFYIEERLQPQLNLSLVKGLLNQSETPSPEKMKEACHVIFQNVQPSLLHGDLWSGNYLIAQNGDPYLIDPAVYYGHSEVDIAMSKLFGGFGDQFYKAYHKIIPKDKFTDKRITLYQLYYLLVHLNLFGHSYYRSVKHILSKHF